MEIDMFVHLKHKIHIQTSFIMALKVNKPECSYSSVQQKQEAQLKQRDCASVLSVEILYAAYMTEESI